MARRDSMAERVLQAAEREHREVLEALAYADGEDAQTLSSQLQLTQRKVAQARAAVRRS